MVSALERRMLYLYSFLLPPLGFLLLKGYGHAKDANQAQRELAMKCAVLSSLSAIMIISAGLFMVYH